MESTGSAAKADIHAPGDSTDPSQPSGASNANPSSMAIVSFDSMSKKEEPDSPAHSEEVIILDSENENEFAEHEAEIVDIPKSPKPTPVNIGAAAKTKRGKRGAKKAANKVKDASELNSFEISGQAQTKPIPGRIVYVQRSTVDGSIECGLILVVNKNKPGRVVSFFRESCVYKDVSLENVDLTYVVGQKTPVYCCYNPKSTDPKEKAQAKERFRTGFLPLSHANLVNFEQKLKWISHPGFERCVPDEGHVVWKWLRGMPFLSIQNEKEFLRGELPPLTTKDLYPAGHEILPAQDKKALMALEQKSPIAETFVHTYGVLVDFITPRPRTRRSTQMIVELVRTKERVIVGNKHLGIWGIVAKACLLNRLLRPGDFMFIVMGTPKVPSVMDDLPYKRVAHASFGLPLDVLANEDTYLSYEFHAWLKSRDLTVKDFVTFMKAPPKTSLPYPIPTSESWTNARVIKTVNFVSDPAFPSYAACVIAVVTDTTDIGKAVLCLNEKLNVQGLGVGYTSLKGMFPYGHKIHLNCRQMLPHERIFFSGALMKTAIVPPLIATYWSMAPKKYEEIKFEPNVDDPTLQEALSVIGTTSPEEFLKRYIEHNAEPFRISYDKFMFSCMRRGVMSPQMKPLSPRQHALMIRLFSLENERDRRIPGLANTNLERSELEFAFNIIQAALNCPNQATTPSGGKKPLKKTSQNANNGPPPPKKSRFEHAKGSVPDPPIIGQHDFKNGRIPPARTRPIQPPPPPQGLCPPSKYGNYPSLTTEAYRSLTSGPTSHMNSYRQPTSSYNESLRSSAYDRSVRPDPFPSMAVGPFRSASGHIESDRRLQELTTREEFLLKEKKILELESEVRRMRGGVGHGFSSTSRSLEYRKLPEEEESYERHPIPSKYYSRAHSSGVPMAPRSPSYGGEWSWEKPLDSQFKAPAQTGSYERGNHKDRGQPLGSSRYPSRSETYADEYSRAEAARKDYKRSPTDHPASRNDRGSSDWIGKYWV